MKNNIFFVFIFISLLIWGHQSLSVSNLVLASSVQSQSNSKYLPLKDESMVFTDNNNQFLYAIQITGASSWTNAAQGVLTPSASNILAQFTITVRLYDLLLTADENILIVSKYIDGLVVLDISGKGTWTTSSVTNLDSKVIASYTSTQNVYEIKLNSDQTLLYMANGKRISKKEGGETK